jgi:SAM-dependent methyltransferase
VHPRIFAEFDAICRERKAGGDVLEIGAMPAPDTLLALPSLAGARSKLGVNLAPAAEFGGFRIVRADANDLGEIADGSFDTVLSNSVLEHDAFFWRTLAEIRRVARSRALIVLGVPGFTKLPIERVLRRLARVPGLGSRLGGLAASTLVLQRHPAPEDYYRFSPEAMRDVFLSGLEEIEIRTPMIPPRVVGAGIVPAARSPSTAT